MNQIGFIGDIHGDVSKLIQVVDSVGSEVGKLVFLGDYVDRGKRSKQVIEFLIQLRDAGKVQCEFIAGNHDKAFLSALHGNVDQYLQLGGAATIRSYIDVPQADLRAQIEAAVPPTHVQFLETMVEHSQSDDYFASHAPSFEAREQQGPSRFGIYGHVPQLAKIPRITKQEALIDTGCGTVPDGRLTCLYWPSMTWSQSD